MRPQIDELSQLRKDTLRKMARDEGLTVIGNKKGRIAQNLTRHRMLGRGSTMKRLTEDIANEELKSQGIEGAFNDNFRRYLSKGVDEGKIVTIEEYLSNKGVQKLNFRVIAHACSNV